MCRWPLLFPECFWSGATPSVLDPQLHMLIEGNDDKTVYVYMSIGGTDDKTIYVYMLIGGTDDKTICLHVD